MDAVAQPTSISLFVPRTPCSTNQYFIVGFSVWKGIGVPKPTTNREQQTGCVPSMHPSVPRLEPYFKLISVLWSETSPCERKINIIYAYVALSLVNPNKSTLRVSKITDTWFDSNGSTSLQQRHCAPSEQVSWALAREFIVTNATSSASGMLKKHYEFGGSIGSR